MPLSYKDAGIYECTMSTVSENATVITKYKLAVTPPIRMQSDDQGRTKQINNDSNVTARQSIGAPFYLNGNNEPEHIIVTSGRSVRMKCVFGGDPPPEVTWLKDGKLFEERDYSEFFEWNVTDLFIENTSPNDSGYYTCLAKNKNGKANYTHHLEVKSM